MAMKTDRRMFLGIAGAVAAAAATPFSWATSKVRERLRPKVEITVPPGASLVLPPDSTVHTIIVTGGTVCSKFELEEELLKLSVDDEWNLKPCGRPETESNEWR